VRTTRPELFLLACVLGARLAAVAAEPAVALRVEQLTVPPATGPLLHVVVHNLRDAAYRGQLAVRPPAGWRLEPAARPVALGAKQKARVVFTIAKGTNLDANRYRFVAVATAADGSRVVREQEVACASAPYFEPRVDGRTSDWANALPVAFAAGGKSCTVSTYWNRKSLCLLVEVEEDRHIGYRRGKEFDAVQIAVAPRDAHSPARASDRAARCEFLLAGGRSMWARDRCFVLARPDTLVAATQRKRELEPLETRDVALAVKRRGDVTRYEAAIPFAALPGIEATEGREFCFSVLVHDPDGTGLRDFGDAAGLWPTQRNRLAWSLWPGAKWGKQSPFDNRIEWGFCSSKH